MSLGQPAWQASVFLPQISDILFYLTLAFRLTGINIFTKWTNSFFCFSSSKWRFKLKLKNQGKARLENKNVHLYLISRAGRLLYISTTSTTTTVTTTSLCWKAGTTIAACTGRKRRALLSELGLDEDLEVSATRFDSSLYFFLCNISGGKDMER